MSNGKSQLNATGYAFEIRTCFKTENIKFMQITIS